MVMGYPKDNKEEIMFLVLTVRQHSKFVALISALQELRQVLS